MSSNEQQSCRDELHPHVKLAYDNSANASTGLAPNEIRIGHQSLDRSHLTYCNLATERQ